jgi:hypothetical protein
LNAPRTRPNAIEDAEYWLSTYDNLSPQGPGHASQWLGTPLTFAALIGLLWSMPRLPALGEATDVLNWATFFLMATVVYYFILSIRLAFGSLPFVVALAALGAWLERLAMPLTFVCAGVLLASQTWQIVTASRLNGRFEPLRHLQHLIIAPLWLLAAVYRRLGIRY